jgi:hypothetical protein|tara:strand:- start:200 stop:379 length:180 start_codon:yes stop_codon:yes gene_type:complete
MLLAGSRAWLTREIPCEALHKIRFGQPGGGGVGFDRSECYGLKVAEEPSGHLRLKLRQV